MFPVERVHWFYVDGRITVLEYVQVTKSDLTQHQQQIASKILRTNHQYLQTKYVINNNNIILSHYSLVRSPGT